MTSKSFVCSAFNPSRTNPASMSECPSARRFIIRRHAELQRSASKLAALTPAQRGAVEALTRGLTNKFLHGPLQALRTAASEGDQYRLETLREIFHLPDGPAQEKKAVKQTSEPRLVAAKLALCES